MNDFRTYFLQRLADLGRLHKVDVQLPAGFLRTVDSVDVNLCRCLAVQPELERTVAAARALGATVLLAAILVEAQPPGPELPPFQKQIQDEGDWPKAWTVAPEPELLPFQMKISGGGDCPVALTVALAPLV